MNSISFLGSATKFIYKQKIKTIERLIKYLRNYKIQIISKKKEPKKRVKVVVRPNHVCNKQIQYILCARECYQWPVNPTSCSQTIVAL